MPSSLTINVRDLLHFRGVESARVELKASWDTGPTLAHRQMRLTARVNGHEVPRNVALLFFNHDPEEMGFRGARIEVVHFADGIGGDVLEERIFRGPLHHQIRDCLGYLGNLTTHYLEKHGDRPETTGWVSFPYPALEEALVNAVYHRSYDGTPEPTKVYLFPDRMEITSYPGPVPGVSPEHFRKGARVPPVPARNRRIGEILKELRLAEARGTGVPSVYRAMAENGSPEPKFEFDEARSYFMVTLPAHPEHVALSALREAGLASAKGDRRGAIRILETARSSIPSSGVVVAQLIDEYSKEGDLDPAERAYRDLLSRADRRGAERALLAMAEAYLAVDRKADAIRVLDDFDSAPTNDDLVELGILERRAGRDDRAHELLSRAGDRVLGDVRATHELALSKLRLAERLVRSKKKLDQEARRRLFSEAENLLRRVIQMNAPATRRAWAWWHLAQALQAQNAPVSEVRRASDEARSLLPLEPRFAHSPKKR